jgi:hypothetical protein
MLCIANSPHFNGTFGAPWLDARRRRVRQRSLVKYYNALQANSQEIAAPSKVIRSVFRHVSVASRDERDWEGSMLKYFSICTAFIVMTGSINAQREAVLQTIEVPEAAFDIVLAMPKASGATIDLGRSPEAMVMHLIGGELALDCNGVPTGFRWNLEPQAPQSRRRS